MSHPLIEIDNISKVFNGNVIAVAPTTMIIEEGEFFVLLGPSGCGKTTLMRMIAGFENPSSGRILIDGKDLTDVGPNFRPTNMVFQSYAVFPHMTVADNVAYGLKVAGTPKADIPKLVQEGLNIVRLAEFGNRRPDQLSGGQRQRVALARALVKRPKVLLLDEPLSALDAKLRESMQVELVNLQNEVGITFIMVTHDQDEALSMASRIAVMEKGQVKQIATPIDLYEFPHNRFVADFIGKMNLFEASYLQGVGATIDLDVKEIGRITLPFNQADQFSPADQIGIAIRPEKVRLDIDRPPQGRIAIEGTIRQIAYYGNASHVYLRSANGTELEAKITNDSRTSTQGFTNGTTCWFSWDPSDTLVLRE